MDVRTTINCFRWLSSRLNIVANLTAENLSLRQQLIVMKRNKKRPVLKERDRLFWVILSRFWSGWRDVVSIVQPETVVRWHRKSERGERGRPSLDPEIRAIVLRMANANPLWGAPTIHGELLKLGINISERTVSKLIGQRTRKPSSQTWRTFIKNHMTDMVAIDFLVVPTIRFQLLYVFIVLNHSHRRVVHFNVTASPTAAWTLHQIVQAFPWDTAPRDLLRDRDKIYGEWFRGRIESMSIKEVVIAYHSPWQNPYVERFHGSIRRECTDHVIAFGERHLRRILEAYFKYYHEDRKHLGLGKETPMGRGVSNRSSPAPRFVELPRVGGLHHRYEWSNVA